MKRKAKRLWSLLLSMLMVLTMLPVTDIKAEETTDTAGDFVVATNFWEKWDDDGNMTGIVIDPVGGAAELYYKQEEGACLGDSSACFGWADGKGNIQALSYDALKDQISVSYAAQRSYDVSENETTAFEPIQEPAAYYTLEQAVWTKWDEETEENVETPIENVTRIHFYKVGCYQLTYNGSSVIYEVTYPTVGLYTSEAVSEEGIILGEAQYSSEDTELVLYAMTSSTEDADRTIEFQINASTDEKVTYEKIEGTQNYKITVDVSQIEEDQYNLVIEGMVTEQNGSESSSYQYGMYVTLRKLMRGLVAIWPEWENDQPNFPKAPDYQKTVQDVVQGFQQDLYFAWIDENGVMSLITDSKDLSSEGGAISVSDAVDEKGAALDEGLFTLTFRQLGNVALTYQGSSVQFVVDESRIIFYQKEDYGEELPCDDRGNYSWRNEDYENGEAPSTIWLRIHANDDEKITDVDLGSLDEIEGLTVEQIGEPEEYTYKITRDNVEIHAWSNICVSYEKNDEERQQDVGISISFDYQVDHHGEYQRPQYEYGEEGSNYSALYVTEEEYYHGIDWEGYETQEEANAHPIYWFNADTIQELLNVMNGSNGPTVTFKWTTRKDDNTLEFSVDDINTRYVMIQPSVTDYTELEDEYIYSSGNIEHIRLADTGNAAQANPEDAINGETRYDAVIGGNNYILLNDEEDTWKPSNVYQLTESMASYLNDVKLDTAESVAKDDYVALVPFGTDEGTAIPKDAYIYKVKEVDEAEWSEEKPYRFSYEYPLVAGTKVMQIADTSEGSAETDIKVGQFTDEFKNCFKVPNEMIIKGFSCLHINADCDYNMAGWFKNKIYFALGTNTEYTLTISDGDGVEYQFSYDILARGAELPEYINTMIAEKSYTSCQNPIVLTEQRVEVSDSGSYTVDGLANGENVVSVSKDSVPDISGQEEVTMSEEQMKVLEDTKAKIDTSIVANTIDPKDTAASETTKNDINAIYKLLQEKAGKGEKLNLSNMIDFTVSAIVKDANGKTVGFDKNKNDVDANGAVRIRNLYNPMEVTLKLPKALLAKLKNTDTVKLICMHDGTPYEIEAVYENGAITFEADKFSTYAIVTTADLGTEEEKPTPSPSPSPSPSPAPSPSPTPTPTPSQQPAKEPEAGTIVQDDKKAGTYQVTSAEKKEVTYMGAVNKKAKNVTIPATIKIDGVTYKVTKIAEKAFKGNKKVQKIVIGKNVKQIGADAFRNCKNLKKIVIQTTKLNDKNVHKKAFRGVTKKTVITVPSKKLKAYRTLLRKKSLAKSVTVKKA